MKMTIISQAFHNERALFISQHVGIDAVGFNAKDVVGVAGAKTKVREFLARVKAVLDIHVLKTKPRFLGDPVEIG